MNWYFNVLKEYATFTGIGNEDLIGQIGKE